HLAVALDRPSDPGLPRLLKVLAELSVAGVPVDPEPLFAGRDAAVVTTTAVPPRPGWTIDGHMVRTADGAPLPGGLRPAEVLATTPLTAATSTHVPASAATPSRPAAPVPVGSTSAALPSSPLPSSPTSVSPFASAPAVPSASPFAYAPAAPSASADRDAAVLEFLRGTRELVATQREVMLGYLGAQIPPISEFPARSGPSGLTSTAPRSRSATAGALPGPSSALAAPPSPVTNAAPLAEASFPGTASLPAAASLPATASLSAQASLPAPAATGPDVLSLVVATVSERTGYPSEMLDPGLDLEADLSVDSIKRTELIGELADRLGFGGVGGQVDESVVEELARIKTIRGIVDWIQSRTGSPEQVAPTPVSEPVAVSTVVTGLEGGAVSAGEAAPTVATVSAGEAAPEGEAVFAGEAGPAGDSGGGSVARPVLQRFAVQVGAIEHPVAVSPAVFAGHGVAIVADGRGIGLELADLLEEHGASASLHDSGADVPTRDGLVYLAGIGPEPAPDVPAVFGMLRRALLGGVRKLVVVTGSAGTFGHGWSGEPATDPTAGAGLRGLVRTIAREYPDVLVRAVDVDLKEAPRKIARHLLDELGTPDAPVVVGYTNGTRTTLHVTGRPPATSGDRPAAGAVDVVAACRDAGLGPESVVLLTGGARGITAAVAGVLARVAGCHVELVGRTPLGVEDLDREVRAADGEPALRRLLVQRGMRDPAEIGAAARRLAAEREIRLTLERLAGPAASVRYTAIDVRDSAALSRLVGEVRARHGRLDTIVHGAGLCEDRLLAEKSAESFSRVFGTKVDGARALAAAAPPELAHLILFGSVSGVFGNRGQSDYAAANDALDTLARTWQGRIARRVLSVDWGPWAPEAGGMVTPELAREYARRGVDLIDPADGVAALLAELAWGRADQCQIGFLAGPLSSFDAAASR
ncbi:MAG TPA: SDR family NAD(P)-dependent oxidoreductase, partial [Actinoplanes sp.]|nr:SDR family NAD(P)-dependent oxidoreductase [Actinoplanes sp.]